MRRIPVICTTTIEIPLILQIQKSRTVFLYEPKEERDIEVLYLPHFGKRENDKNKD